MLVYYKVLIEKDNYSLKWDLKSNYRSNHRLKDLKMKRSARHRLGPKTFLQLLNLMLIGTLKNIIHPLLAAIGVVCAVTMVTG